MSIIGLILSLWQRAREARRRRGLRRYLMETDELSLADIGVSRAQALFELDSDQPPSAAMLSSAARCPSPVPRKRAT
jgi:uncharacterized protein YjiS (DUF1127 family)